MIEEVLFRRKRRYVLWKDHIGFLAFSAELRKAMNRWYAQVRRIDEGEAEQALRSQWEHDPELIEAVLAPLRRNSGPTIGDLQAWLWERSCPWTIIDYRVVQPFRRSGGSKRLSRMKILGRPGDVPRLRCLNEVTTVLSGFGAEDGKELRFFAYRLAVEADDKPDRMTTERVSREARTELAEALAEWAMTRPGALEADVARALSVPWALSDPSVGVNT
jgi:hypothetical protein